MKKNETAVTNMGHDAARRMERHRRRKAEAAGKLAEKVAQLGDDALLDEFETGAFLGKSVQWLRNRRIYGGSLPYRKIGGSVRYRLGDLKSAMATAN